MCQETEQLFVHPGVGVLMERLAWLLLRHRYTVSCAESCSGGMLAQTLSALPGSSRWFEMAFVCYSDDAKTRLVGVPEELLRKHGAVSEPVVRAMAEGAVRRAGAQVAAAISGIAGPGGGTANNAVGTVWFGWAHQPPAAAIRSSARCLHLPGTRGEVRARSVAAALEGLLSLLSAPHDRTEQ